MTRGVPDLELDFTAFVVFGAVVSIEDGGLVQTRENFLRPGHDHRRLADGCIAYKDQLHVVFLVLIYQWFCLYHILYCSVFLQ